MNDPKTLREDAAAAGRALSSRNPRYAEMLKDYLKADESARALIKDVEEMRARRNTSSKAIGKAKKDGDEGKARELMKEVSNLKAEMADKEPKLNEAKARAKDLMLGIPNIPDSSVPAGKSEDDNAFVRGAKNGPKKKWNHVQLLEKLDIADFEASAKLSGSRFAVLKGAGARLHRVLAQFMIDVHTGEHGYEERWVPYIVRPEVLEGTGQLPKFEQDLYKTGQFAETEKGAGDSQTFYMIPTAEVPLTNLVRKEILDASRLPMKVTAYTPCFRQEAGSYGKDVKGLIRQHQFEKVELVWVTKPEDSMKALEELTSHAENVLKKLELPYRVIELCTADIGFCAAKTYDLEIWFPGEGRFRETSSCSNCSDFQARRMNARFRRGPEEAPEFVHTLNGSGLAVGRVFAAILENYQLEDGSVEVPKALRERFGSDKIEPAA